MESLNLWMLDWKVGDGCQHCTFPILRHFLDTPAQCTHVHVVRSTWQMKNFILWVWRGYEKCHTLHLFLYFYFYVEFMHACTFVHCSGGIGFMKTFLRSIKTTSLVPLMEMRIDCLWILDTDISRGFGSPTVGSTLSQSQSKILGKNAGKLIGKDSPYSCHHYLISKMLIWVFSPEIPINSKDCQPHISCHILKYDNLRDMGSH